MSHQHFNTIAEREQQKREQQKQERYTRTIHKNDTQERYTTCGSVCTTNTTTTYKTNRNETSKLLTETDGKRTAKNGKRTAHGWRTDRPTNGVKRNHFHNFIAGRTRNEKNSFVLGNGCKQSISIVKETNIVNRRHETRGQSDQANTTETAKEDDQNNEQQTKRRQQLHSVTKIQQTN